jgi:transcriptional regulator with XRE-family HTH domain
MQRPLRELMPTIHAPQYIEFVTRLRNVRKAKRITQSELAELLHKPQSYVSKVETCERRLDVIEAAEWCIVLGITLGEVLPNDLKSAWGTESHHYVEPSSRKDGNSE